MGPSRGWFARAVRHGTAGHILPLRNSGTACAQHGTGARCGTARRNARIPEVRHSTRTARH
eukprot:554704-Pyramimonas_sp.AAC.2